MDLQTVVVGSVLLALAIGAGYLGGYLDAHSGQDTASEDDFKTGFIEGFCYGRTDDPDPYSPERTECRQVASTSPGAYDLEG